MTKKEISVQDAGDHGLVGNRYEFPSSGNADLIYGDGTAVADFRNVDGGDVLLFHF